MSGADRSDLAAGLDFKAPIPKLRLWWTGFSAAVIWLLAGWATHSLDDLGDWERTDLLAWIFAALGIGLLIASLGVAPFRASPAGLRRNGPWLAALGVFFIVWELLATKWHDLLRPFFPPPQSLLELLTDDYAKLGLSVYYPLKLYLNGYILGGLVGFITGVSIGWSRAVGYWAHPILRFIGPLPATAWLPIAFFAFPSSHIASVTQNLGVFVAQRPGLTAPTVLARQFATLDQLYPGRISINVNTVADTAELAQDGMPTSTLCGARRMPR